MSQNEILFGFIKKPEQPPIKSLFCWPEPEKKQREKIENSGKWLSETQDAYKRVQGTSFQNPTKIQNNVSENKELNFSLDLVENTPLQCKEIEEKNKNQSEKSKKNNKNCSFTATKHLPNSSFAKQFEKPVFALYGHGSKDLKNKPIFSKGSQKTFNVLPYTKENKNEAVHKTAKIQAYLKRNKSDIAGIKKNTESLGNTEEKKEENSEKIEILPNESKNDQKKEISLIEKVENSTQIEEKLNKDHNHTCVKCNSVLTSKDFDEKRNFSFEPEDPRKKNPKTFKNMAGPSTNQIPYAGQSKKKSESAYKVLFGSEA